MTSLTDTAYVGTLTADTINYTNLNPSGGGGGVPISNPLTADLDCNNKNVVNGNNITCVNIDFTTSNPPIPTGFVNNPMTEELQGNNKNFVDVNDVGCVSVTASGQVSCVGVNDTGGTQTTDLAVGGNATIGGTLTSTGGITGNGGLNIVGNESVSGTGTITGDLTIGNAMTVNGSLTVNTGPNTFGGATSFTGKIDAFGGVSVGGNYVGGGEVACLGNATFGGFLNGNRLVMTPVKLGPVDLNASLQTINITNKSKGALTAYNTAGLPGLPKFVVETGVVNAVTSGSLFVSIAQTNSGGSNLAMLSYRTQPGASNSQLDVFINMGVNVPTSGNPIRINLLYVLD